MKLFYFTQLSFESQHLSSTVRHVPFQPIAALQLLYHGKMLHVQRTLSGLRLSLAYKLFPIKNNPINPKDRIANFFNTFVFIIFNLLVDKIAPEDFLILILIHYSGA
jgi:hypothetical protein